MADPGPILEQASAAQKNGRRGVLRLLDFLAAMTRCGIRLSGRSSTTMPRRAGTRPRFASGDHMERPTKVVSLTNESSEDSLRFRAHPST